MRYRLKNNDVTVNLYWFVKTLLCVKYCAKCVYITFSFNNGKENIKRCNYFSIFHRMKIYEKLRNLPVVSANERQSPN